MRFQDEIYQKRFAQRVATMIESRLIWYKHYSLWTDELIIALDKPPTWLLDIATLTYYPEALEAIKRFVYSEPFEAFQGEKDDEYVACLFLRHERGEIAWATFLNEAGVYSDRQNGHRDCEYFYVRLNILENKEYAREVEQEQRKEIEQEYAKAIASTKELYGIFLDYFRKYLAKEA
ncbi:MAG TPA: hypothetical protein VJ843_00030 [Candidatus Saccharimonadales bacterium]|nr:hypothetical protein [Candidatus Saccharimonadales bacterium]